MARIVYANNTANSQPAWAGDYFDREHLLPGGSKLNTTDFTAVDGVRYVPSGTIIGRTFAERLAGTAFGPAAATDEEFFILAHDVTDAAINNDCTLYRYGSVVKENRLPNFGTLNATVLAAIRDKYQTTEGAN